MRAIKRLHLNLDHEHALGAGPLHIDHAFWLTLLQVQHVLAVHTMHGYALIAGDEANNLVSRHRHAASGKLDPNVSHAFDGNTQRAGGLLGAFHLLERQRLLFHFFVHFVAARIANQVRNDVLSGDLPFTDCHEHSLSIGEIQLVSNTDQRFGSQQCCDRKVALAHGSRQFIATFFNSFGTTFLAEPLANLVTGFRALREAQPVTRRTS